MVDLAELPVNQKVTKPSATMIKLFSLKQQKRDGVDGTERSSSQKKASAAQLRIQKG